MREILGDVLGSNFKGVTLKNYTKALKKVEDKEDYETGKQTLKDNEENHQDCDEENEEETGVMDQVIDMEKISNALPPIYIYGLKMIEGYSGNFDAFKEEDEEEENEEKQSKASADSRESEDLQDDEDKNFEMHQPRPLGRTATQNIIKEEKSRFQKHYGFT